jgi:hypothetical protein
MLGTPVSRGRHGLQRRIGQAAARLLRVPTRIARQRPWWKWLAIAVLLAATVTVTVVYSTTLAKDIARQHWAAALDASREAVLVIVGWASVFIVLSAGDDRSAEQAGPVDSGAAGDHQDESQPGADSVLLAQDRVRRLRARLAELAAARERAGSGADPDLEREVASTSARLEQARQWLTSAQSALAVSRSAAPQPERSDQHTRASASLPDRRGQSRAHSRACQGRGRRSSPGELVATGARG